MFHSRIFIKLLGFALLSLPVAGLYGEGRGRVLVFEGSAGKIQSIRLYEASYALLLGVSDYQHWPRLESVPGELAQVEAVLQKQGFTVEKHLDPNARQLENAFEGFIDNYGYTPGNRLLFFFSGHGHTRKGGTKGYLVP
ncbi:MAG: caspase family protein, partial [Gammaproteobacteria bacterium]|nr:caspase family protein [Gammaproteobacteria bacterium]